MRTSKNEAGQTRIEPWIVSTSLDGTIRKWRFSGKYDPYDRRSSRIESSSELATSTPDNPVGRTEPVVISPVPEPTGNAPGSELTEEEERELAELMGEDLS